MKAIAKSKAKRKYSQAKIQARTRLPDAHELHELERLLGLSSGQLHHLRFTLEFVQERLEHHSKNQEIRPQLVPRLKRIEKAFDRLERECGRHTKYLGGLLPTKLPDYLGSALSMSEINDMLGTNSTPDHLNKDIEKRQANGNKISVVEMDAISVSVRQTTCINHGDVIFSKLIARLHRHFKDWVEFDRLNKGGRPENLARTVLIWKLAQEAPYIIGRNASKSETGPFARLCAAVLPICGIDSRGVEKAIPRVLDEQARKI